MWLVVFGGVRVEVVGHGGMREKRVRWPLDVRCLDEFFGFARRRMVRNFSGVEGIGGCSNRSRDGWDYGCSIGMRLTGT